MGNLTINNGITATNTGSVGGRQFTIAESNVILGGNNTWTVNNSAAAITLAVQSVVTGGFGITLAGNGTLTMSGNNTYTGATVVNGGNFEVANSGQLGGGNYAGNITIASGLLSPRPAPSTKRSPIISRVPASSLKTTRAASERPPCFVANAKRPAATLKTFSWLAPGKIL